MTTEGAFAGVRMVTVSYLSDYLHRKLDRDKNLQRVGVEGEVTKPTTSASGHVYFNLTEGKTNLSCVAFASTAAHLPKIEHGATVLVYGRVGTYSDRSTYQLTVQHLELAGIGRLYQELERRRKAFELEGLFRSDRKRRLPLYPFRVALVGSRGADGTRDFLTEAATRAPQVQIEFFHTPVQGDVALQIVGALKRAYASDPDAVVLVRGGGSFHDLFVFNDEQIVRTIAGAVVPTVTAIGHETNTSLADLAADRQAMTPTAAAQVLLPARADLVRDLQQVGELVRNGLRRQIGLRRMNLDRVEYRSPLADQSRVLAAPRQRLDTADELLRRAATESVRRRRLRLFRAERSISVGEMFVALARRRQNLDTTSRTLERGIMVRTANRRSKIVGLERRLLSRSPAAHLALRRGRLLAASRQLELGSALVISLRRNTVEALSPNVTRLSKAVLTKKQQQLGQVGVVHRNLANTIIPVRLGELHALNEELDRASPRIRIAALRLQILDDKRRLKRAAKVIVERRGERLRLSEAKLNGNNPERLLQRGYAIVQTTDGNVLREANRVAPGSQIRVRLSSGQLTARVERTEG